MIWASSKQSVATVSDAGLVTAVSEGTATITATSGGKKATCVVTVTSPVINVESVELDKTEIALTKGETFKLNATVKPDNASETTVIWTSADEAVAKVDQSGEVTAMGAGSTVITASAGEKSADCTVTVTVPVESVALDRPGATMATGETLILTATVLPEDATDKSLTWASTNPDIADVDQEGKVK